MKLFHWLKNPKVIAFAIGIFICCLAIIAMEVFFSLSHITEVPYSRLYYADDDRYYYEDSRLYDDPRSYFTLNAHGVKGPIPGNYRVHSESKKNGKTIYDITYSIDQFGRRITPVDARVDRDKFLLLFGGSFAYGEGVEGNQTLPYHVGALTTRYMPYNYGFHGLGPFDVLAKLETTDFAKEVEEKNGIVIYLFMDDHVKRTFCSLSTVGWLSNQVYYDIPETGRLIRKGSFASQFPVRMHAYKILSRSRLLKVLHINFPRTTTKRIEDTARIIEEMDYYVRKRLPQSRFYVLLYPRIGKPSRLKQLISHLDNKNIRYLDYSALFSWDDPRFILALEDMHPNAHAHQTLANALVKDLHLE